MRMAELAHAALSPKAPGGFREHGRGYYPEEAGARVTHVHGGPGCWLH